MVLLEAENIIKQLGDRLLFALPSLRIYTGDKIGLVGLNGAGKTTLLDILSGQTSPDGGSCRRYCEITYIRQFSDEAADADGRTLREFNLAGKAGREALSGGEQARVKLANAISQKNSLLLADEPTSNLDLEGVELLRKWLSGLESFVVVSHDRDLLDRIC
ncbi:MAG: ATP-binding cassette domain-containing protein, partial [Clostridia bacterium]|nr:ATP-binding cassette domain-containing protein [Clostridia bacterium]